MAGEIRYIPVWQAHNPHIRADAMALWARLKVLPAQADPVARADEICMAAYDGNRLVGVETCRVRFLAALDARFAFTNVLVDPDYRQCGISSALLLHSYYLLAGWAQAHPEERLAGTGFVLVNPKLGRRPVVGDGFFLIGFSHEGHQLRITWFENYRLHDRDLALSSGSGHALRWEWAWRRNASGPVADAMALWTKLGMRPRGVETRDRTAEISLVGYDGERPVAVSTVKPVFHPGLGEIFAGLSLVVDLAYAHADVRHRMAKENFSRLEQWSAADPGKPWAGLMTVYEDPEMGAFPVDPSGLVLAGYAKSGGQIRLNWFAHAQVEPGRAVEKPFLLSG